MQQTITNPNTFGDLDHYKSTLSGEMGENSLRRKIISLKKFISFVLDEGIKSILDHPLSYRLDSSPKDIALTRITFQDGLIRYLSKNVT